MIELREIVVNNSYGDASNELNTDFFCRTENFFSFVHCYCSAKMVSGVSGILEKQCVETIAEWEMKL